MAGAASRRSVDHTGVFHAALKAVQAAVLFYFRRLLPVVGWLFSSYNAYKYLPDSVLEFPSQEEFSHMIAEAGFRNIHLHELTFGIATIYVGEKE